MANNILSLLPVATGILIFSTTLPVTGTSRAAEREQQLAGEIVETILDGGGPATLTADGHEFLGIKTPAESVQIRIERAGHYWKKRLLRWSPTGWRRW